MSSAVSRSVAAYLLLGVALVGWQPAADCRAADDAPAAKQNDKSKGRLPDNYSKVVDPAQRDKIYQIQQNYAPQIQQLQAQLKTVTGKRDAEIDALLTPEQRTKLAALQVESQQAAAKKRAAAKTDAAQPAATSTTTTAAPK
ncbi:MAG TPA: hypothetical protein VHY20_08155 [Pirellulales bacterium]|jgi:hypothetical protein|nr:hypothetical protein [Pirellulales bacterium]